MMRGRRPRTAAWPAPAGRPSSFVLRPSGGGTVILVALVLLLVRGARGSHPPVRPSRRPAGPAPRRRPACPAAQARADLASLLPHPLRPSEVRSYLATSPLAGSAGQGVRRGC